jgi:hypothetical protein
MRLRAQGIVDLRSLAVELLRGDETGGDPAALERARTLVTRRLGRAEARRLVGIQRRLDPQQVASARTELAVGLRRLRHAP